MVYSDKINKLIEYGQDFLNDIKKTCDVFNTHEQSNELEFIPFLQSNEGDVIRATSTSQSASIDHGRSLI